MAHIINASFGNNDYNNSYKDYDIKNDSKNYDDRNDFDFDYDDQFSDPNECLGDEND